MSKEIVRESVDRTVKNLDYELSALDLHYLVKELQFFKNAKFEKAFHDSLKETLVLKLRLRQEGPVYLQMHGKLLFYSFSKQVFKQPSMFAMVLRKHLSNAVVNQLSQQDFERIVNITFSNGKTLVLELFSKGNAILLDENNKILGVAKQQVFKHRSLKIGFEYKQPPSVKNVFSTSVELLTKSINNDLKTSGKTLVQVLSTVYGFGGFYAELICKMLSKALNIENAKNLRVLNQDQVSVLKQVANALLVKDLNPCLVQGRPVPFQVEGFDCEKRFKTFNEAIVYVAEKRLERDMKFSKELEEKIKELEKLKNAFEKQKNRVEQLKALALQEQRKAELLFENYVLVDELLKNARKLFQTKSLKMLKHKNLVSVDEKKGLITINLE
ncbi:NFACT family protein [Candidatus Woesearchaeota archaeon]|nr:NFACT family protein [Candidatus Woesearchaeota archaeon]